MKEGGATGGAQVVQKVVPQRAARFRTVQQESSELLVNRDVMLVGASKCDAMQNGGIPPRGVEPLFSERESDVLGH